MELARKELGEDAFLVNARPADPETRKLGAFEVVFGVMPPQETEAAVASPPRPATLPAAGPPNADLAELKREMARMAQTLRGLSAPRAAIPPEEWDFRCRLLDAELDHGIVEQMVQGTSLSDLFTVDANLGRSGTRALVVLVGPPGAGKTTTLIKLAARYGLASRRPAHIVSADVLRIAAADQLRTLASILGIGCTVVETPGALAQAIEEQQGKEFVFVDTPGLGPHDMEDGSELARFIAEHADADTHLVLPATLRPADISAAVNRYQIFRPDKLLFTHVDEAACFGALVSESARRSLPISFLGTGQQVPDDLEPATRERLTALVLRDKIVGDQPHGSLSLGAAA